ncbi:MAG: ribonucleoside triphosphate reductase, partial [Candidatus Pacearchaeota archaeon]
EKRDGRIVDFDQNRITDAIFKALTATGEADGKEAKKLSDKVVKILERRFKEEIPNVEQIQDIVEEVLILGGLVKTAKAYILYREQRRRIREAIAAAEEAVERIDQYLEKLDWEVQENANMAFSLQGLNHYGVSYVIKKYWLNKVYPKEIREAYEAGDLHIHNLDSLATYCCGWDLYDLLLKGFGGVPGKVESKPPKHFRTALLQLVNFFYTLQGESAGAQAISNFDTLLAPFIYYDNLDYKEVKQALQEFLFNMAVPTRTGFQCPFTNITLDLTPSPVYAEMPVIVNGQPKDRTYKEFAEEMKILNKALYEVYMEGDKSGRPFHFPIPTINITKDFPWNEEAFDGIFEASGKYGINYFANYVNSEMKPEDVRSMCCRLRLDLRELYNRGGGGLFGSGSLTGSIGVVTINLPRIGYLAKTKKQFFEILSKVMDLAKESLEIKRKTIENFMEKGLYPYSKFYLSSVKQIRNS